MARTGDASSAVGPANKTGSSSGQKERQGGVQVQQGGTIPGTNDLVRGKPQSKGKPSPTDPVVMNPVPKETAQEAAKPLRQKSRITLEDYKQTKNAVASIEKANKKALESALTTAISGKQKQRVPINETLQMFSFSPPRKKRQELSPTPSPPPRLGNSTNPAEELDMVDTSGYAPNDYDQSDHEDQNDQPELYEDQIRRNLTGASGPWCFTHKKPRSDIEDHARSRLNQQTLGLMASGNDHGRIPRIVPRSTREQEPAEVAGMPRSDLFTMLLLDIKTKYSDVQKQQAEMLNIFSQQQKLQRLPTNTNTPLMDAEQSDEDQAAFDDDEEMSGMSWSGQPPSSRQVVITVSDEALDCWAEKIGIDEQGKKELRFKRLPRYPNKLKVYTEGEDLKAFSAPRQNKEFAIPEGWRVKEEEDLLFLQKYAGGAASALCHTVDNIRGAMDDLMATSQDFRQGKFEDPCDEAEKVCGMMVHLLEEGAISHVVNAINFLSVVFGTITLKRHSSALTRIASTEARKVLEDNPPDAEFLFGKQVKESVQAIRDKDAIKDVFDKRPPYVRGRYNRGQPYRNIGGRGGGGRGKPPKRSNQNYRPYEQRFRGRGRGRRRPMYEYEDKKDKKGEKKKFDD